MSTCSVHGKNRTEANLVDDGCGGFQCAPNSQCQTSGGNKRSASAAFDMNPMMMNPMMNPKMMQQMMKQVQQMMGTSMPNMKKMKMAGGGVDQQICTVHFKERSVRNLIDDGEGGYCCSEGEECKGGAGNLRNVFCSLHKKKRSEQSLVDDGEGGKQCAPDMQCQMGADRSGSQEQVECSMHGKNRSMRSCIDDGNDGYQCAPGSECQMGAGGASVVAKPAVRGKGRGGKAKGGKAAGKWR